jgi:iron(III) transport system permease protein
MKISTNEINVIMKKKNSLTGISGFLSPKAIFLGGFTLIIAYLSLVPIITLLFSSFQTGFMEAAPIWTFENYKNAFSQSWFYRMFWNSLQFAFGSTLVSLVLGFILAWIYVRTSTPLKSLAVLTAVVPFIVPGILNAIAWIFLLSPEIGLINMIFKSTLGFVPFTIYSMGGMIWIESLSLLPISFFMIAATLRSMDTSLEEAAYVSGANKTRTFLYITLRLAKPGLISATLLLFVQAVSSFEVPFLIGYTARIDVFVSQIYDSLSQYPTDYGLAGALSFVVLAIAVLGVLWSNSITKKSQSFATITGKGFKPTILNLGKWKIVTTSIIVLLFGLVVVLPLGILIWASLLPNFQTFSLKAVGNLGVANFKQILTYPGIIEAFSNSIVVALTAAAVTMFITTVVSYITIKTKLPGRWMIDGLAFIPIAVPGTVMGISILLWYLIAPLPFNLYGTLTIIVIAFVTNYLPYGMRYMSSGIVQIKDELEEAAMASGATWLTMFWKIYRPLLMPSLMGGFIYIMIAAFREISMSVFLVGPNTQLVPIIVMNMWEDGKFSEIAALGVVMIVLLVALVVLMQRLTKRRGGFFL